jgi:hypothetical protein
MWSDNSKIELHFEFKRVGDFGSLNSRSLSNIKFDAADGALSDKILAAVAQLSKRGERARLRLISMSLPCCSPWSLTMMATHTLRIYRESLIGEHCIGWSMWKRGQTSPFFLATATMSTSLSINILTSSTLISQGAEAVSCIFWLAYFPPDCW